MDPPERLLGGSSVLAGTTPSPRPPQRQQHESAGVRATETRHQGQQGMSSPAKKPPPVQAQVATPSPSKAQAKAQVPAAPPAQAQVATASPSKTQAKAPLDSSKGSSIVTQKPSDRSSHNQKEPAATSSTFTSSLNGGSLPVQTSSVVAHDASAARAAPAVATTSAMGTAAGSNPLARQEEEQERTDEVPRDAKGFPIIGRKVRFPVRGEVQKGRKGDLGRLTVRINDVDYCLSCPNEEPFGVPRSRSTNAIMDHLRKEHKLAVTPYKKGAKKDEKPGLEGEAEGNDEPHGVDPDVLRRKLANVMVENCLAFRFVESASVKDLLGYLCPDYKQKPLSRHRITAELKVLEKEVEASISEELINVHGYSITLDSWKSCAGSKFLAVTLHGVNLDWEKKHFLLGLLPLGVESETGQYIAKKVMEVLDKWQRPLCNLVVATSDGGSNVRKAVKDALEVTWYHCAAHVGNLVIGSVIGEKRKRKKKKKKKNTADEMVMDEQTEPSKADQNDDEAEQAEPRSSVMHLFTKARQISQFFKRSSWGMNALTRSLDKFPPENRKPTSKEGPQKLKFYSKTRWDSAYEMMQRLLDCEKAVSCALRELLTEKTASRSRKATARRALGGQKAKQPGKSRTGVPSSNEGVSRKRMRTASSSSSSSSSSTAQEVPAEEKKNKLPSDLAPEEWLQLKEVCQVLQPFARFTKEMSKESLPISSAFVHFQFLYWIVLAEQVEDLPILKEMKATMRSTMEEKCFVPRDATTTRADKPTSSSSGSTPYDYCEKPQANDPFSEELKPILLVAVYLDPRTKTFAFLRFAPEAGKRCQARSKALVMQWMRDRSVFVHPSHRDKVKDSGTPLRMSISSNPTPEDSLAADLDQFFDRPSIESVRDPLAAELERYDRVPSESQKSDPLQWWSRNGSDFPTLARLARRVLSISATSVPSERVFSKVGWMVNKRRTCLSDEHVARLAFIACNRSPIKT